MKPVLVLQNQSGDGPGYFGQWMRSNGVPFIVFNSEAGDAFPDSMDSYGALAILGGEMGANDPLPSLRAAERLILDAMAHGQPVIGHCLGGQLMARALGARVTRSPAPEVGWHALTLSDDPQARRWLGDTASVTVFQWHEDMFEVPPGATLLATSKACPQQAFALGKHLALQFHAEIDVSKLKVWVSSMDRSYQELQPMHSSVHQPDRIRADTAVHIAAHQRWADGIYRRWLAAGVS